MKEKKTFPEMLSEGLDGLPVSWCCRLQKIDKVRLYLLDRRTAKFTLDFLDDKVK